MRFKSLLQRVHETFLYKTKSIYNFIWDSTLFLNINPVRAPFTIYSITTDTVTAVLVK